jgi:hypothetical protein
MPILSCPADAGDLESWYDAYRSLGLAAVLDPPEVVVRTGDALAVLELPVPLGQQVRSQLVQMMQPTPVLHGGGCWLFFTDPAGSWPRGSAYMEFLRAGGILHEQWSRIALPSSATGDERQWISEPRNAAQTSGTPRCVLPRLWTVTRAVRKAQAAQR